jgi:NADH:ubiquinone oxidoreductase subunit E
LFANKIWKEDVFKGKEKAKQVMNALEEAIVTTIFLNKNALEFIAKMIGIIR